MFYTIFFILLTILILTRSSVSASYTLHALTLWYSKMIPSLLPFMILSGIMVRMNLTERIASFFQPVFHLLFRCRKNVSYGILMGFLCGFPMGARVTAELYTCGKINRDEAEYLLAFCNNIGPVYYCSFVLPLLQRQTLLPYLFAMYGIPFLYGIFLRHTRYRSLPDREPLKETREKASVPLLDVLDISVHSSIDSITMLCGYMILFNLLNIIPHFLLPAYTPYIAPLLEITGGLSLLGTSSPLYSLIALSFGGLSCIAQTYHMIHKTDLSLGKYVRSRLYLTALTACFYLLWRLFCPSGFLR